MLKVLRKKGVAKKILWVIAIIIIISFGFFGQSFVMRQSKHSDYAGKVFGRKISMGEFQRNFDLTQVQAMIQYGDNFSKIREHLNLVSQTWDRIILLSEVNRLHISVSNQEVIDGIAKYPIFQRDNRFDRQLYHNILRYVFKMTPRDFEEGVRDTLRFYKLFEKETFDVTVNDDDVFKAFQFKNEKVQASYVLLESDKLKGQVTFDENKAKEFYQSHRDAFLIPPTIKVEYLQLEFPTNKTPETLTEAEKDATFSKALDVSYAVNENPDFNKAAEKFGLTVNRTDYFNLEEPDIKLGWSYPVMQRVSQLKLGESTEPLETLKGYQLIKLLEKRDAFIPEYAECKDKVREAWIEQEALKLSKLKAEEYLKTIKETFAGLKRPDFPKVAKDLGLEINQTPVFARGEYLPKIGISRDFQEKAFALTPQDSLSPVAETPKGYCILHLESQVPVNKEDFNKEKEKFTQALMQDRKNGVFSEFISRLRLKANLEDDLPRSVTERQRL